MLSVVHKISFCPFVIPDKAIRLSMNNGKINLRQYVLVQRTTLLKMFVIGFMEPGWKNTQFYR